MKDDQALKEAEAIETDGDEDIELDTADSVDTLIAMTKIFHSMANEIVDAVRLKHDIEYVIYVLTVKPKLACCNSLEDNFRYFAMSNTGDPVVKGYKSNRAGMEVPEGLNDIYEYVFNLPATICVSGIEADDVCVYKGRQGHIVAALDKDVLGSLVYAYNYGKKEWVEHTEEEVAKFPFLQTIMGDSSDGLRGVYRVGAKGAEKALADIDHTDEYAMWVAVIKQYYLKDQSLEEAVATMRCVRMDEWTEEKGLVLWTPPSRDRECTREETRADMKEARDA
jgi:hypothetical protein